MITLLKEKELAIAGTVSLLLMMNFPTSSNGCCWRVKKSLFWVVQFSNKRSKTFGQLYNQSASLASD